MNRTMTAAAIAMLATGTLLAPGAHADDGIPTYEPMDVSFTIGDENGDGQRAWSVSVDGQYVQPEYSEDGLVDLEVAGSEEYDQVSGVLQDTPERSLLGEQKDDGDGVALRGCPETDELAQSPVRMSSDDPSFTWVSEGGLENPGGHYEDRETRRLDDGVRSVSISTLTCVPRSQVEDGFTLEASTTYLVRTGEESMEVVGSSTMPLTPNEGSAGTWFAEPGWEFLEQLQHEARPEGTSDAAWADQLVAKGVVPADKRWYVANEEPVEPGPVVDTGVTTRTTAPAVGAGLAGLALLAAGAGTLVSTRRR